MNRLTLPYLYILYVQSLPFNLKVVAIILLFVIIARDKRISHQYIAVPYIHCIGIADSILKLFLDTQLLSSDVIYI